MLHRLSSRLIGVTLLAGLAANAHACEALVGQWQVVDAMADAAPMIVTHEQGQYQLLGQDGTTRYPLTALQSAELGKLAQMFAGDPAVDTQRLCALEIGAGATMLYVPGQAGAPDERVVLVGGGALGGQILTLRAAE